MSVRTRHLVAVLTTASLVAVACGSGSDSESASADDAAEPVVTTEATTTTTEPAPTTTEPAPTTTIASPEEMPPNPPAGMELVWSDEFDGDEVDRANWTYDIGGWGWGNGEMQYYTDRPTNARTQNGLLVIELHQEKYEESYFTSARLKSQGLQEFRYGRIEARIKVPSGKGTWPAFWMLGASFEQDAADPANRWPTVGEIDVMEYVGREPNLVLGTVHGPGFSGAGGKTAWFPQDFPIADDFHLFAIDWDETGIRWFFDGQQYHEVTPDSIGRGEWVFDQPFFIILNLALGGTLGGLPALDLEYPIQYYVDWVRVYQPPDDGADA